MNLAKFRRRWRLFSSNAGVVRKPERLALVRAVADVEKSSAPESSLRPAHWAQPLLLPRRRALRL
jgi:hypothetical protein